MPRKGHSNEAIITGLRQSEAGAKVPDVRRRLGVSEQSFYRWHSPESASGSSASCARSASENSKLKELVADLTLDRHILQETVRKSSGGLRTGSNPERDPAELRAA